MKAPKRVRTNVECIGHLSDRNIPDPQPNVSALDCSGLPLPFVLFVFLGRRPGRGDDRNVVSPRFAWQRWRYVMQPVVDLGVASERSPQQLTLQFGEF